MPRDDFDAEFDELIEKGFIEKVGVGPDGEPEYRLTVKAADYLYKQELLTTLKQNSPKEIFKQIMQGNQGHNLPQKAACPLFFKKNPLAAVTMTYPVLICQQLCEEKNPKPLIL